MCQNLTDDSTMVQISTAGEAWRGKGLRKTERFDHVLNPAYYGVSIEY